jgi:prepilin-type N-terminal cleavage/methylation domain-containing protein
MSTTRRQGFTLIELSIVLVIIGLIVGGVLVGQSLIAAAGVRATISQIEKYNTAVNTFREKYGGLPGDLNASLATQFGFAARGVFAGEGDGNGVIEGVAANSAGQNWGTLENIGETTMFWVDFSQAKLIDGSFSSASSATTLSNYSPDAVFPQAKMGGGNYIYVWSGGWSMGGSPSASDGINYFGIIAPSASTNFTFGGGATYWSPGLTVQQAYGIDKKIDDGLPQSGNVMATYAYNGGGFWAAGNGGGLNGNYGVSTWPAGGPSTASTAGSAITCYDNSAAASGTPGVNGTAMHYSLEMSGGTNINCALSFRFQ